MADNTATNTGSGGDTIRDKDRSGVKTQVVGLDIGIGGASEVLMSGLMPVGGYQTTTTVDVALASAATSAQVLAANAARKGLFLTNTDANTVYIYYGTTATAAKFTVSLAQNGYWEMPWPIWTGRIDAIWAVDGSGSLIGSELS